MALFREFTKRQLWQRFLVQKVPTFYMIVDKSIKALREVTTNFWQNRRRKLRAAGLNTVETFIPWNIHQAEAVFDFEDGGTEFEEWANLAGFIRLAQQEDLFVIIRLGPYIGADWEFGGLPSALLSDERMKIRPYHFLFFVLMVYYFDVLLPILSELQFTKGGPIIMVQVENELSSYPYTEYLRGLYDMILPGLLFQTIEFESDIAGNFGKLDWKKCNRTNL
jgi:beta-galactosidase GanA